VIVANRDREWVVPSPNRDAESESESSHELIKARVERLTNYRWSSYPSIAITRIEKRLKIDGELQQKLKQVAKLLNVEI
jgi:hypothetical protein